MDAGEIAEFLFSCDLAVDVCSGIRNDDGGANRALVAAGSASAFLALCEQKGDVFSAALLARHYGLGTTALLSEEQDRLLRHFFALVPPCRECAQPVPELFDSFGSVLCDQCAARVEQ